MVTGLSVDLIFADPKDIRRLVEEHYMRRMIADTADEEVQILDDEKDEWEFLPAQYDVETRLLVGQVAAFSEVGVAGAARFPNDSTHYLLSNVAETSAFTGGAAS